MEQQYLIKTLFSEGKYDEIVKLYDNDEAVSSFNRWDYYYTIRAFYKLGDYDGCENVFMALLETGLEILPQTDDIFGWALYQKYLKGLSNDNPADEETLKALDWIFVCTSDDPMSPRWKSLLKYGKTKKADPELLNKYLDTIDPKSLSNESTNSYNIRGRQTPDASDRENWYKLKSNALFELGDFDGCIKIIEEAFSDIPEFHFNNDIWLNNRLITVYMIQGKYDEAESKLNEVLVLAKKKNVKHWIFEQHKFDICVHKGDVEGALKHGSICSITDNSHEMRVGFYLKFAEYLQSQGYEKEATLHCRLVQLIREERAWSEVEMPSNVSMEGEYAEMDKGPVLKELGKFWMDQANKGKQFKTGTVKKILANGFAGFVTEDSSGSDYYFSMNEFVNRRQRDDVYEGARIRFVLEERMDRKKGEMKLNAVEISLIQ